MRNKKIIQFLKEKEELLAKAAVIQAVTEGDEPRAITEAEQTEFDGFMTACDEIDVKIGNERQLAERRMTMATVDPADELGEFADKVKIEAGGPASLNLPNRGFPTMGEFAMAVFEACNPASAGRDERLLEINGEIVAAATGMSQSIGADGGFTIPPEFSNIIWDGMREADTNLLTETDGYTVQGESLTFNGVDETSRATGSRFGGVRGYWLAEAAQMTGSKPKFRQVKIEPKDLAVLVYVTDKLLNNSPIALQQFLTRAASSEISFMTSDAIIEGDGSGKPLGILNSDSLVSVAKESGQAADTILYANILRMWSRCHAKWRQKAKWYINQDIEPQLNSMVVSVGTGGAPIYLPAGGLSASPYATLMGRPVRPIEFCSTLGDKGDIILGNLGAYCSGTKGTVKSAMSIHLRFDYNETAFRFIFSVDGQPWIASPLTPFKGTNTLSPFVTLAAR